MDQNGLNKASSANEILLDALAAGLTYEEAGVLAGVSSKTVQRRVMDADFASELMRRRSMRVEQVTTQLTSLLSDAVATLAETMRTGEATVKLRAAEAVLRWTTTMRREVDFDLRLSRLESPSINEEAGDDNA